MSNPLSWIGTIIGWLSSGNARKELEAAARMYREYAHDLRDEFAQMRKDIADLQATIKELKAEVEECQRDRAQLHEEIRMLKANQ